MIVKTNCSHHMQNNPCPKHSMAPPKTRLHLSLGNQPKPTVSSKYPAFFVLEKKSRAALLTGGWFLTQVVKSSPGERSYLCCKTICRLDFTIPVVFLSPQQYFYGVCPQTSFSSADV